MAEPSSTSPPLHHVPLHSQHVAHNARIVPFAGFAMPLQYQGVKVEHLAVRSAAGLFDVSHMGEIEVNGHDAIDVIDRIVTNDLHRLVDGQALYTVMCHEDGGIVDDLLVYRLAADHLLLCVNAANRQKDFAHITRYATGAAQIQDTSDQWAQLAIQGPRAVELVHGLTEEGVSAIQTFHAGVRHIAGVPLLASRTGYTGEDGFELYIPASEAAQVFEAICTAGQAVGLALCGLGARDTLRLEARLHLYGQDMDDTTNPLEAGLGWVVKTDKRNAFIGRDAILDARARGLQRKLCGFIVEDRGIIRHDCPIQHDGETIGHITSGSFSYMLDTSIGLGYVSAEHAGLTHVDIIVRDKPLRARLTTKPFYKNT